jgi:hypothetical protein
MKTNANAEALARARQAIAEHDRTVETSQARIRELEEHTAAARTLARSAWADAASGIADGDAVAGLNQAAMTRDGEIRALETAIMTLRERLQNASGKRDALLFEEMVSESKIMCSSADEMLMEWYASLETFLQISGRISSFMRELDVLTSRGDAHRNRCQAMGFPVEEDAWTPAVPMPNGFDFDRLNRMADQHWWPAFREFQQEATPQGRLEKARARVSGILSRVGISQD